MTVRGTGCMEESHGVVQVGASTITTLPEAAPHSQERHPNHPPHLGQQQRPFIGHTALSAGIRVFSRSSDQEESENQHNAESRSAEADDELPLGSEANTLGQRQEAAESNGAVVAPPPVDKRLLSLRQGGVGAGKGIGQLLHSGWTSFNSDISNLTSGSAQSNSSVEWLLQKRQEDPEKILYNLGFCGPDNSVSGMYSRIPDRFLHAHEPESARGEEDGTQEGGSPQRRTPSRAWGRIASLTSASLKLMSYGHQRSALGSVPPSIPGSHYGSTPSLTPPGPPRSILNVENQRALALQGFYGDNPPEGIDLDDLHAFDGRNGGIGHEDVDNPRCARDRRKIYHKTRSKQRQTSLVESGEDEEALRHLHHYQQHRRHSHPRRGSSSNPKSAEFSTTTESTDSGGELSTAPTTPGDVFLLDRPAHRASGRGLRDECDYDDDGETARLGPTFPGAPGYVNDPYSVSGYTEGSSSLSSLSPASGGSWLSRTRQKLTEHLMQNTDDSGADYFRLSPTAGRQPTVEKASTLTDSEATTLERALAQGGRGAPASPAGQQGSSSRDSTMGRGSVGEQTWPGQPTVAGGSDRVSIVVSAEDRGRSAAARSSGSGVPKLIIDSRNGGDGCERGAGITSGGMSLLHVDNTAAADRLSDSGSDKTLVEQSSSSGGASPRPTRGRPSPRYDEFGRERDPEELGGPGDSGPAAGSEKRSRQRVEGPVLYVYRKLQNEATAGMRGSGPDENDNFPTKFKEQIDARQPGANENCDDDLPRMSSVQSDSSGFGDTEVSADSGAAHEMATLKVGSLGSSCESSATAISNTTVYTRNSVFSPHADTASTQTQTDLHQFPRDSRHGEQLPSSQQEIDGQRAHSASARPGSAHRYVTMCFIPNVKAVGSESSPRGGAATSSPGGGSKQTVPKYYTVVFSDNKSRASGAENPDPATAATSGTRYGRAATTPGGQAEKKNETPLREELARASMYPTPPRQLPDQSQRFQPPEENRFLASSAARTPRCPVRTPVTSLPSPYTASGLPRQPHSVDGEYSPSGSGDELEAREPKAQSYLSWRSDLPSYPPRRSAGGRGSQQGYPGTSSFEGNVEGSGASLEGSSVYSCASTSDSIKTGSSGAELLDCQKLVKLINTPTIVQGRKTHLLYYKPKRHMRYWPSLAKKKRLQEETRLAQYAIQKYKTELNLMETAAMVRYQMMYDELPREERADVEELQGLWAHVRQQLMETEQLLTQRMRTLVNGNDGFSPLASLHVLQQVIELLKEQLYQKQVEFNDDDVEEGEEADEDEWEDDVRRFRREDGGGGRGLYHPRTRPRPRLASSSWADLPRSPMMTRLGHGHLPYSSSTSHLPQSPAFSDQSYDQFRSSLLADIRQELKSNLHTFQQDLQVFQQRESEIQQLQEQLMSQQAVLTPKSSWSRSMSRSMSRLGSGRQHDAKETDV